MGCVHVVWFKRDLRIVDHAPLVEASCRGPVLPLYVVEPELWQQQDASARQWAFCREALVELRQALAALGMPLVVRRGEVVAVLARAHRHFGVAHLWSHEETGNGWTYARDRRVAAWARSQGIPWSERPQFGVVRPLPSREGWAGRWEARMASPILPAPVALEPLAAVDPGSIPSVAELGLADDGCVARQPSGRSNGLVQWHGFLTQSSQRYQRDLSNPARAVSSCSRLSAHLSWGTLSMREVIQDSRGRRDQLLAQGQPAWALALHRFEERLHWHCHFMQKLEDQPSLEFSELHPHTAGLRELSADRLAAWSLGCTGLPFVDACMRSLIATGWLNFRMRAMLLSVASYQLWLPWRDSGLHLARLFVDYEPGIHWSQCQMQSGTTGINTIRIYNPLKQALDHDPRGLFVRRWLPELAQVPAVHLHHPWTMDGETQRRCGCVLGRDYPSPIVDWSAAAALARDRLWALRRGAEFGTVADAIQRRHGSRRAGLPKTGLARGRRGGVVGDGGVQQLCLDFNQR